MLDIILGHFLDCVLCQLLRLTSHRVVAHDHPHRQINRSGPVLADRMHDIAERDDTDQAIVVIDHHGDRRSLALELSGNDDQRVLAMHPEDLAMVQLHDAVERTDVLLRSSTLMTNPLCCPARVYVLRTRFSISFPQGLEHLRIPRPESLPCSEAVQYVVLASA